MDRRTYIVISAYEGVIINEWNGMMEGWGSALKDRTIFISFHLWQNINRDG